MNTSIKADQLSYSEMVLDTSGSIVSREEKAQLRQQYGYCMTCQDTPVLLVDFQRARLNPLWSSKKPRTADGECLNGKCLRCNPHIIPTASCVPVRTGPIPSVSQRSITSCDSSGSIGMPVESFHSSSTSSSTLRQPVSFSPPSRRSIGTSRSLSITPELMEPRRAQSTDGMPPPSRDARPRPPRRTVSFDRAPGTASSSPVVRAGTRRPNLSSSSTRSARDSPAETPRALAPWERPPPTEPTETDPFHGTAALEDCRMVQDLRGLIEGMQGEDVAFLTEILLGSMEANEQHEAVHAYCLEAMAGILQEAVTESTAMIAKIVSVMAAFSASLPVQRSGCQVLDTLAGNSINGVVLIRTKACECMADALAKHTSDARLVQYAIAGLRKLSVHWEARQKLMDLLVSDRITEAMQCHSSAAEVQRDGCALLSNIAVDGEKRRVCVVGVGALSAAVDAIKGHLNESNVVASACFALKNFTYDATNLRSLTKTYGVFDVLQEAASLNLPGCEDCLVVLERIQLARAEDESLEEQAMETLLSHTEGNTDGCDGVVADIIRVMRDTEWSAKVVAMGLQILGALASYPEHKIALETQESQSQLSGFIEQYIADIRVQHEARALMAELSRDSASEVETGTAFITHNQVIDA